MTDRERLEALLEAGESLVADMAHGSFSDEPLRDELARARLHLAESEAQDHITLPADTVIALGSVEAVPREVFADAPAVVLIDEHGARAVKHRDAHGWELRLYVAPNSAEALLEPDAGYKRLIGYFAALHRAASTVAFTANTGVTAAEEIDELKGALLLPPDLEAAISAVLSRG